jgi:hypothetical protein
MVLFDGASLNRLVGQVKHKKLSLALAVSARESVGYETVGTGALLELLEKAHRRAGLKKNAAVAIGMTPSRFARLLHPTHGTYSLSVGNCFRLAKYIGETPQAVLRAAGKDELAAALDEYYGPTRTTATPAPRDPLVSGLAEVLAMPGADRDGGRILVNMLRKHAGLPAIEEPPAHRRVRSR